MLLDAPEEKGRITEYLEGNLLEPVPDLRCPGIVAQQDGMIGGKRKARRGSLGADIQGRELGKRGSLWADKGHAWRQEWLRKDDHDRLSLDTAHGPSSRLRVLDVGRDRSTHLHAVSPHASPRKALGDASGRQGSRLWGFRRRSLSGSIQADRAMLRGRAPQARSGGLGR